MHQCPKKSNVYGPGGTPQVSQYQFDILCYLYDIHPSSECAQGIVDAQASPVSNIYTLLYSVEQSGLVISRKVRGAKPTARNTPRYYKLTPNGVRFVKAWLYVLADLEDVKWK